MATNIGPKIGIDGEAEYRKQLQDIINETKTLGTEMQKLQSTFDSDKQSIQQNKQQRELLTAQIEKQKQAVQQMKDMLEKSKSATGENSSQTERWRQAVNKAETDLNKMKGTLEGLPSTLGLVGQKMQEVGAKIKTVGDNIKGVGSNLTTHITTPILGAGAVAVKMASDYEENLNKVDVAFGKNADQVKAWASTATDQFGLSENAALEATSLFGDMGTSMGLTSDEAADMATNLAGLAGDLSSFKNVDIKQAMTALNGVFTGETESLKTLGVVMTETNLKGFAEDLGLVYEDMSQAEKVTLRYQYVLANTANAQGDYARTSDGAANSFRTLQAEVSNLAVSFGQEILPVITPLISKVTDMVKAFGSLDEGTKKTIITIAGVAAAVGPVLVIIGSVISAVGTIVTTVGAATTAIGGISTAMAAAGGVAGILSTAGGVLAGVFAALVSPIGLAIAAVAAITAAGIALYQNWDTVKAKAAELAGEVKAKWEEMKTNISTAVDNAKQKVEEGFGAIKTKITEIGNTITDTIGSLPGKALTWGKDLIGNFVDGLKKKWDDLKDQVSGIAGGISNILGFSEPKEGPLSDFHTYAPDMMELFASGIRQNMGVVRDAVSEMATTVDMGLTSGGGTVINQGGATVTVYAQDGQSARQIAEEVADIINGDVMRGRAAWA